MSDIVLLSSKPTLAVMRISTVVMLTGLSVTMLPAPAADWSDTSIGYRTSNRYTEPSISRYISKNIYTLTHASGYAYGSNFFSVDFLESDENDPINGGGGGAQEVYGVYRHTLSLGSVSGSNLGFGPVKDIGFTIGIDRNSKNDAFSPRVRKTVLGPTVVFDVPGYFNVSLLLRKERNHNGIVGTSVTFDDTYGINLAWSMPINMVRGKLTGFLDYIGAKGKDGFGADTAPETLSRAYLMFDIGSFAGKKETFFAGAGYEYWNNKYGVATGPGNDTNALVFAIEAHL